MSHGTSTAAAVGTSLVSARGVSDGTSTAAAAGASTAAADGGAAGTSDAAAVGTAIVRAVGSTSGIAFVDASGVGLAQAIAAAFGAATAQAFGASLAQARGDASGHSTCAAFVAGIEIYIGSISDEVATTSKEFDRVEAIGDVQEIQDSLAPSQSALVGLSAASSEPAAKVDLDDVLSATIEVTETVAAKSGSEDLAETSSPPPSQSAGGKIKVEDHVDVLASAEDHVDVRAIRHDVVVI